MQPDYIRANEMKDDLHQIKKTFQKDVSRDNKYNIVRILHSPSHPAVKGTPIIIEAIDSLKSKGYNIKFIQIHGRPNSEVLNELQRCHFVVDQIYSDLPMAGFAAEAAWFGKPAVVGGYRLNELQQYIPEGMCPPSFTCHSDYIEEAIEELVVNDTLRNRLGQQALEFVQTFWTPEKVAERYLRLIEDDIPDDWWFDPNELVYLHGCGLPKEKSKENIQKMVDAYGVKSLQLSHRPDLENAFLQFAGISRS